MFAKGGTSLFGGKHCCEDVAQVGCTKPQRHKKVGIHSSVFMCARKRSKSGFPVVVRSLTLNLMCATDTLVARKKQNATASNVTIAV
jgi:hypothetical protein